MPGPGVPASSGSSSKSGPNICEVGGKGLVFPVGGEYEAKQDNRLKVIMYGAGLVYCFLGVSIVADLFMSAIERITSKKKRVKIPGTKRYITTEVWNDTVANLTLMALGSSAPEILLNIVEILKNEFFNGDLGPSTIVGSGAFNLFVIIAVCMNSIPHGEVRQVKALPVFYITAVWSIFAYVWLLFIVQLNSQNVIEDWEGAMTFMFFPIMVAMSFAGDKGWLTKDNMWLAFRSINIFAADEEQGAEDSEELGPVLCILERLCLALRRICNGMRKIGGAIGHAFRSSTSFMSDREPEEDPVQLDEKEAMIKDETGQPLVSSNGILTFNKDTIEVGGGAENRTYTVAVLRKNGDEGKISCQYHMESLTATPGYDYVDEKGELNFRDGVGEQTVTFTVLPKQLGESDDSFQIILTDATGGAIFNPYSDGGAESCAMTVHILNENDGKLTRRQQALVILDKLVNLDELRQGSSLWKDQIKESLYCNGSWEEQENAQFMDWVQHIMWFPWKVPFAVCTPPTVLIGGWPCFLTSLFHLAWVTILISDLAELFGCSAGFGNAITAITIVAMGTSVPDMFASKTAAVHDEWADASIVNVTGSNSVNVFLGIGLPWMVAAFYWKWNGPTARWESQYRASYPEIWPGAAFIVEAGNLAFSVSVFAMAACICLAVICVRRSMYGGELGGARDPKAYSSALLFFLWIIYIGLSVWKIRNPNASTHAQLIAVALAVPILLLLMVIFAVLFRLLDVTKQYIGEDGSWALFGAFCVIGGRMVIFFVFQRV